MHALYSETLNIKDALVDLGVDGLILTNRIYFIMCDTLAHNTAQGPMASSFEHCNTLFHKRRAIY